MIDPRLVERAVENLISNALRFVGAGQRIEIAAWVSEGQLNVAVRNNGPAINAAVRETLFRRHGDGEARQANNHGLGLYLCRLVAEAHQGSIELESHPAWPVSFVLRLGVEVKDTKENPAVIPEGLRVSA